jgi:sugar phosphate isomerase/epimerase
MKLGFMSAILGDQSGAEVLDFAAAEGFDCVELASWPKGQAERRYAGVCHVDADASLAANQAIVKRAAAGGVSISSLGYYSNPLDPVPERAAYQVAHLKKLIELSADLGIGMVTTFIGRDSWKNVEDNFRLFLTTWPAIIELAEARKVRIGIENCPMYFGDEQWPAGLNLATTPAIWRRMFKAIPSPSFGLNYDPSHFVWQRMDYVKPIYEFRDRIFHVHFKDIRVFQDKLDQVGIMATPLEYMAPKLPGLGDIDWAGFVSALMDVGYDGPACIEVEDRAFEGSLEERRSAIRLSRDYLRNFVAV